MSEAMFQELWRLICAVLVFSMQCGFASLEVGSCRARHIVPVLFKNCLDAFSSIPIFILSLHIFDTSLVRDDSENMVESQTFFQSVFCATAATIVSGSMAERLHVTSYAVFTFIASFAIYPIPAMSVWGAKTPKHIEFLFPLFHDAVNDHPFHDCAGSGVVHMLGGCCALVGNLILGRRVYIDTNGRLQQKGIAAVASGRCCRCPTVPDECLKEERDEFRPNDRSLVVNGTLVLWVGWMGFNAGGEPEKAGKIILNTMLAGCSAGMISFARYWLSKSVQYCVAEWLDKRCSFFKWSWWLMRPQDDLIAIICNSILSGLVAITAPCDIASIMQACAIGATAGFLYVPFSNALGLLIDDPVDAVAVHLCAGLQGVLCVALLHGNFEDGRDLGPQLLSQLLGGGVIMAWSAAWSLLVWGLLATSELILAQQGKVLQEAADAFSDHLAKRLYEFRMSCAVCERELEMHMEKLPILKHLLEKCKDGAEYDLIKLKAVVDLQQKMCCPDLKKNDVQSWVDVVKCVNDMLTEMDRPRDPALLENIDSACETLKKQEIRSSDVSTILDQKRKEVNNRVGDAPNRDIDLRALKETLEEKLASRLYDSTCSLAGWQHCVTGFFRLLCCCPCRTHSTWWTRWWIYCLPRLRIHYLVEVNGTQFLGAGLLSQTVESTSHHSPWRAISVMQGDHARTQQAYQDEMSRNRELSSKNQELNTAKQALESTNEVFLAKMEEMGKRIAELEQANYGSSAAGSAPTRPI